MGLLIAAIGISVVFSALILIFIALSLFDRLDRWMTERSEQAAAVAVAPQAAAAAPAPKAAPPVQPVVEEGISAEVVAAISAAVIAAFDQTVRVKLIRYRRQAASPQWHLQGRVSHVSSRNISKNPRRR
ncbi:MAG: OadG family protein [Anaerolineales bacterium]|nr:OadG family protein [Anaerolineales bacterium]